MVCDGVFLHFIASESDFLRDTRLCLLPGSCVVPNRPVGNFPASITCCRSINSFSASLTWFENDNHLALNRMDFPT